MTATKVRLQGGPWNGKEVDDLGTSPIRMTIATAWKWTPDGRRPAAGARSGYAIYEPSQSRADAFWLDNVWEGTTVETQNPDPEP